MTKYHSRNVRIYIDGYDMSGYLNSFEAMNESDIADVSTFASPTKEYVTGLTDDSMSVQGFFDDDAQKGVHDVMSARLGSVVHAMFLFGRGVGQYVYAGSAELQTMYNVGAQMGGANTIQSKYVASGTQGMDVGSANLLMPRTQFAGTPAGSAWDSLVASNSGARLYAQSFGAHNAALSAANAFGTVVVQGGTNAAFTTPVGLGTFAFSGTAPMGSALTISGTVHQHLRVVSPAGTPHVAVAIKRL